MNGWRRMKGEGEVDCGYGDEVGRVNEAERGAKGVVDDEPASQRVSEESLMSKPERPQPHQAI